MLHFYAENGPAEDADERTWRAHYQGLERSKKRRQMRSGGAFGRRS